MVRWFTQPIDHASPPRINSRSDSLRGCVNTGRATRFWMPTMTAEQIQAYTPSEFTAAMVYAARELAELNRWDASHADLCRDYANKISAADTTEALHLGREFAELLHGLTPDNQRWPAAIARADQLLAAL